MTCSSCKGFNIKIEDYNPSMLLESSAGSQDPYVKGIVESVKEYPELKAALNKAYAQIEKDVMRQAKINPADVGRAFKSSVKKHAENGIKEVLGEDGTKLVDYLLEKNKGKGDKLPKNINKRNFKKANKIAIEHTQKSFIGVMIAQKYIDLLFRAALPAEAASNILAPLAAAAAKSMQLEESKAPDVKILIEKSLKEVYAPVADRPPTSPIDLGWHDILDIVGTIEPFGIADGTNILLYYKDYVSALKNQNPDEKRDKQEAALLGAFGSFIGLVIPYAGDIAKFSIKSGVKLTKFVKDIKPLVDKLTQKVTASSGLKKKFYKGILDLIKDNPESIVKNVGRGRMLKPAGLAAAAGASQKAIAKFFNNKLQQVTIKSTAFQAAIFALLKTETFGPSAAYIMALPLASAKIVIDGFIGFVETTSLETWKQDLEKQTWLKDHPALKEMIERYLSSTMMERAIEDLKKALEDKEEKEREKERRDDAIGDAYSSMQEIKGDSGRIKIIIENQKLEEKKFSRAFLRRTMKKMGDLFQDTNFRVDALADTASAAYKTYSDAMKAIDDALTARFPVGTVRSKKVRDSIRTFLDKLVTRVSAELDGAKESLEFYETQTNKTPAQVTLIEKLKSKIKALELRQKEITERITQLDVEARKSRAVAVKKADIPKPYTSPLKKFAVTAGSIPTFYVGGYVACRALVHSAILFGVINWIKKNFITTAFFTVAGAMASVFAGQAWLTAELAQAEDILSKLGAYAKYIFRYVASASGCWDGGVAKLSQDAGKAVEQLVAEKYNSSVDRLGKVQNLSQPQIEQMKIAMAEESWWANIREISQPFISTTRGSVADSLINDYSAVSIFGDALGLTATAATDPLGVPKRLGDVLRKKFFIPRNLTLYVFELGRILSRNGIVEPAIQRQIILCMLLNFAEDALKNVKGKEELESEVAALYIFLFGKEPSAGAAERDLESILREIKTGLTKSLEKAFTKISDFAARAEKSELAKEASELGVFSASIARKYILAVNDYLKKSETERSKESVSFSEKLDGYEAEIDNKIKFHEEKLANNLGEGQKQYHEVHLAYYKSILEKLKASREKLKKGETNFNNLKLPSNLSPIVNTKLNNKPMNCKDLYKLNKKAYNDLRLVVFGKISKEVEKVEEDPEKAKQEFEQSGVPDE